MDFKKEKEKPDEKENEIDKSHSAENIENNLNFYFGNKIGVIYNFGRDILFEVKQENISEIASVLKNNPDFNFNIISSIKLKESLDFLLISFMSYEKNLSLHVKVLKEIKEFQFPVSTIIENLKKTYEFPRFFENRDYLVDVNNDFIIYSQFPETLDTFDIYLSLDSNIVKQAYICDGISRQDKNIFYPQKDFGKIISFLNIIDYKAGIFPELCFCMAIEKLLSIKLTKRAEYIRMLLCELSRISSHLSFIVNMSMACENMSAFNYAITEREKILNILEIITGSRVTHNHIRIGGVKKDIDENIFVNIKKIFPGLYKAVKKIEDIFSSDAVMIEKLKNKASVSSKTAKNSGLTGPNLRASGVRSDLRKTNGYMLYKDFSFTVPLGRFGDNMDRVIIRFKEIYQSMKIISEIIRAIPFGVVGRMVPASEINLESSPIIASVESVHGVLKLYVFISENEEIHIIPLNSNKNEIIACEKALEGCAFENILPSVSSFCMENPQMF